MNIQISQKLDQIGTNAELIQDQRKICDLELTNFRIIAVHCF